ADRSEQPRQPDPGRRAPDARGGQRRGAHPVAGDPQGHRIHLLGSGRRRADRRPAVPPGNLGGRFRLRRQGRGRRRSLGHAGIQCLEAELAQPALRLHRHLL
ncbi:FIG00955358: hypothetical protein, partial [Pseudomonas sp. FEN]